MEYHAHIYFDEASRQSALGLRKRIIAEGLALGRVFTPRHVPVGPHPRPMFELNFDEKELAAVLEFLILHRGSHPVLVHPVTGHDPRDHSDHAIWLGERLELDATRLDPAPPVPI